MKIKLIDFGIKETDIEAPFAKHYNDAGADIRLTSDYIFRPGVTKVPLGFGVVIPDGMMGLILPRSGLNSRGITILYSPIDSGYRGELSTFVYNLNEEPFEMHKGDRVGQLVIFPYISADFVWDFNEDERGTGGFGSTGVN